MCLFRSNNPTPQVQNAAPIQARNPDLTEVARLPAKKELLDPDDTAGVEYGTTAKSEPKGQAQKTGTDALKINLNTGTGTSGETGGINV